MFKRTTLLKWSDLMDFKRTGLLMIFLGLYVQCNNFTHFLIQLFCFFNLKYTQSHGDNFCIDLKSRGPKKKFVLSQIYLIQMLKMTWRLDRDVVWPGIYICYKGVGINKLITKTAKMLFTNIYTRKTLTQFFTTHIHNSKFILLWQKVLGDSNFSK